MTLSRRILRLIAGLFLAGLAGAACVPVTPYAAIVNGTVITTKALNAELEAIAGNHAYLSEIQSGQQQIKVLGAGSHSFDSAFVADILGRQISYQIISQEVKRRHLSVSASDERLARSDVEASLGGSAVFEAFPPGYRSSLVQHSAELTALESSLSGIAVDNAALHAYYGSHLSDFAQSCVSVIVVSSQAEAAALAAQIKAGASFSQVASTNSLDPTTRANGGRLACALPSTFTQDLGPAIGAAISALPVGQVSQPVSSQFGWLLLEVTAKQPLPFNQVTPEIRSTLLSGVSGKLLAVVDKLVRGAHIDVNPRYGHMSITAAGAGLIPPPAPPARDLTLSTGIGPAGTTAG